MTNRSLLAVLMLAGVVGAFALLWGPGFAQDKGITPPPAKIRWEYKVVEVSGTRVDRVELENALNKLGEDGWEAMGTIGEVTIPGKAITSRGLVICKRQKK